MLLEKICSGTRNWFVKLSCSINDLELPLLDRAFTWSNRRDTPTLARLDSLANLENSRNQFIFDAHGD
jgi:hypothetical protein